MKQNDSYKGFTLVELIVVLGVLTILSMILIPSLLNYTSRATIAKDSTNARSSYSEVQAAVDMGYIVTSGTREVGDGVCSFTVVNKVVTEYICEMNSGSYSLDENFQHESVE